MFGKIGKLTAFLLASTNLKDAPTTTTTQPSSVKEIRTAMHQMYQDLMHPPETVTQKISPTIRFAFVSPTAANSTDTWRTQAIEPPKNSDKPIAIYLPGLDGSGISAFRHQFDDMAQTFELWRMIVDTSDRSDFRELFSGVAKFIEDLDRPVILVGESFGGVLASAVALKLQKREQARKKNNYCNPLKGLVLVNPATSFHETNWDTIAPLLSSLQYLNNTRSNRTTPTPYSLAGGIALSYLIPDNDQLQRILDLVLNATANTDQPLEVAQEMMDMLEIIEERLPADTLQHRVSQWLSVATNLVNERLKELQLPTLVVAGDQDRIVPSQKELQRLKAIIPNCETLLVRGRGHFVLDENVNLTEAILYSDLDPLNWRETKDKYDPVLDWKLPPKEELDRVIDTQVKPLRNIYSPVFFSTDSNGKRWKGLGKIPRTDGPILFVANHQFFGLDLGLIISELLEERNIVCRGMAHPIAFNQTKYPELLGRTPGLISPVSSGAGTPAGINTFSNFQKFGAVSVTPRNYYRLLQTGQNALLFPGGVKDVFCTDPSYPLQWPEKQDFVRTAARFNATIVPLSAVGMLEGSRVLVEAKDLQNIPFLGDRIKQAGGFPAARFDAKEGDSDPLPPIPLPDIPKRNYFIFGRPFSLAQVDPKDKETCAKIYKAVVAETRRGIDDIFEARKADPFYDTPRRLAYERITGKRAPSFGMDKLNKK